MGVRTLRVTDDWFAARRLGVGLPQPVLGRLGETFRIDAVLRNSQGQLLSTNHLVMMLADQEQARTQCREKAEYWQALKKNFPTADYYRFFPELLECQTK